MNHAELLARLLPPVSYDPNEPRLSAELATEGATLDRALEDANKVLGAVTPYAAFSMIADWERVCGLVPAAGASYQMRVDAVVAKLNETGGLSIPYFTQLAGAMGYTVQISEPQPFRAGVNRCGDRLAYPDIIYCWFVTVTANNSQSYQFRVGTSLAGERLLQFGIPQLETIFNELKPAWTRAQFFYP